MKHHNLIIEKGSLERQKNNLTDEAAMKLALTSLTSGGRSVGIVRSRTKATELVKWDSFTWTQWSITSLLWKCHLDGTKHHNHTLRAILAAQNIFYLWYSIAWVQLPIIFYAFRVAVIVYLTTLSVPSPV
jgi:hypothetical protein